MKKVYREGKIDWVETIKYNTPTKRKTRSLRAIRKDMKKTAKILAI